MLAETYATALTDVLSYDAEGVGRMRQGGAGALNKFYKWVEFKNTTATVAAGAGSLVGYVALTGYLNNRVCADMTDADAVPIPAGATLATVTGTAGTSYYCWVQTNGPVTLDTAVTSAAAGKQFTLTAGSTDKTGTVLADDFSPPAGVSYNTTTGAVLDCPW